MLVPPTIGRWPLRKALLPASLLAASLPLPALLPAQASLTGRVLTPDRRPLAGVEVSIAALSRRAISDSTGAFVLDSLTPGRYLVAARKLGFRPFSTMTSLFAGVGPDYEFTLQPAPQELAQVNVSADVMATQFAGFEKRRQLKIGRYLTAEDFAKAEGRPTADIIAGIPGVDIVRGRGNEAWYGSRRGAETITQGRRLRTDDVQRGANPGAGMCYATVVLNGLVVYRGDSGEGLFDLNSLNARDIKGVEVYTGTANAPQEWLTGTGGCGVIAIWTK